MFAFLILQEFRPFTIAALIVIGLLAIELGGSLMGASVSHLLQGAFGAHGTGAHLGHEAQSDTVLGKAFGWVNAGRVPVLILLVTGLAGFAVVGMVLQLLVMQVAPPLPSAAASLVAIVVAVPLTRCASRLAASLLPNDETYVIGDEELIGRVGIVTLGPVADGVAARIKVQDRYGNWHFPRVAPASAGSSIAEGASVLIVDKANGLLTVTAAEGHLAAVQKR